MQKLVHIHIYVLCVLCFFLIYFKINKKKNKRIRIREGARA